MRAANAYEKDNFESKVVQIKVLEVLYKDKVCNLVDMHDITRMIKDKELSVMHMGSNVRSSSHGAPLGVKTEHVHDIQLKSMVE